MTRVRNSIASESRYTQNLIADRQEAIARLKLPEKSRVGDIYVLFTNPARRQLPQRNNGRRHAMTCDGPSRGQHLAILARPRIQTWSSSDGFMIFNCWL
jgi:hypothetical protein